MLGKILLTALVVLIAFIVLRQRKLAGLPGTKAGAQEKSAPKAPDDTLGKDLRIGAYLFLGLMVVTGAGLYYTRWQDDHQILTVRLHSNESARPVIYEVYKYQLNDRSFTTVDGTLVTVAASERMEVEGLSD